jgi:hypothetical protein
MTTAPHGTVEPYTSVALIEKPRTLDKYAIEALGTFGPVGKPWRTRTTGSAASTSFSAYCAPGTSSRPA